MSADDIDYDSLLHLLKASSKKTVLHICDAAADIESPSQTLSNIEENLGISSIEAKSLFTNLKKVVAAVVRKGNANVFPTNFHENLRELLCKIFDSRIGDWKSIALTRQVSLPQIEDFSWTTRSNGKGPAKCDINFKTNENREINVELSKETLSAMLDSLTKIREQISSVAK